MSLRLIVLMVVTLIASALLGYSLGVRSGKVLSSLELENRQAWQLRGFFTDFPIEPCSAMKRIGKGNIFIVDQHPSKPVLRIATSDGQSIMVTYVNDKQERLTDTWTPECPKE